LTNEFVQKYIDSALQTDHVEDLSIEAYGALAILTCVFLHSWYHGLIY
jgi:hypothetical protein